MGFATRSGLSFGGAVLIALLSASSINAYTTVPGQAEGSQQSDQIDVLQDDQQIIIPPGPNRVDPSVYPNLDVIRDLSTLPANVAQMRTALIEAAVTGDIESLRPIIKRQSMPPVVSFGDVSDPIEYLRQSSNDGEGRELLAIMIELLESPFSVMPPADGEPAIYVWPAYSTNDLQNLTPTELVDVYKIVSHMDLEEMQLYGGWYFFRVGIDANGEWRYFVAGD